MISHSKPFITDLEQEYVSKVLQSGQLIRGSFYNLFFRQMQEYLGEQDLFFFSSGKVSLIALLEAIKLKDGLDKDEIILPTYVCRSVAEAIEAAGFKPVFCDIGNQWVVNRQTIIHKITTKTKAVIIVNIFGIFFDVETIKDLNLLIIEDNCQAFSDSKGRSGDFSFYSFHATKCLTTIEGGMALAHNNNYLQPLRTIASKLEYSNGYNDLNSAIGLAQLAHYDQNLADRYKISCFYKENLHPALIEDICAIGNASIFFRFPLKSKKSFSFESLMEKYRLAGIAVRKGVDLLLHRIYGYNDADFPNATNTYQQTISIPIYPGIAPDALEHITCVTNWLYNE